MNSFNSTLFDLALNALYNENQAQDENCCNTETQTIIIQALEEEFEIENKGKELKILELEELVTSLRQTIVHLEKSSQQEKMLLEDQIREKHMEITNCQSDLDQISRTHLEVKNQLEIQNQEAQNENEMKAMKITELEAEVRRISAELQIRNRELEIAANETQRLGHAASRRVIERSETISRLQRENERVQRENRKLRRRIISCEELSSCAMDLALEAATKKIEELRASLQYREQEQLKTISDLKEMSLQEKTQLQKDAEMESDRQKSKIKELEELLTNAQSREREYLKKISDLETNSQNEKTRLMAQIQEMENAMINARVPLESSVDDIIDVKVEEKEIKHQNHGKNTCEKWKKGLLIGGGCLAAAVALWKYGPDVSGVASALNQPRLTGNVF